MKKISSLLITVTLLCAVLSAMSFSVYAIQMPMVQVLTFTVSGAETYADGSSLAEDECYALVWSGDGEFDGINPNGTPIGEGDEVVYIGKIYKDSTVVFRLENGFKSGGTFEVYILDTRVFENEKDVSIGVYLSVSGIFLSMVYSDLLHRLVTPEDFYMIFILDTVVILGIIVIGMVVTSIFLRCKRS